MLSEMFTICRNWVPCITLLSFGKGDERWFLRDQPIFQYGLFLDKSIFLPTHSASWPVNASDSKEFTSVLFQFNKS